MAKVDINAVLKELREQGFLMDMNRVFDILEESADYQDKIDRRLIGGFITGDLEEIVEYIKNIDKEEKQLRETDRLEKEAEEQRINEQTKGIMVNSGYSFEGYRIVKYVDCISGDGIVSIKRNNAAGHQNLEGGLSIALKKARDKALKKVKYRAVELGCNAIIGIDYNYLSFDPQRSSATSKSIPIYEPYVVSVTANGTAVIIEEV